jgi:hypothetical protein
LDRITAFRRNLPAGHELHPQNTVLTIVDRKRGLRTIYQKIDRVSGLYRRRIETDIAAVLTNVLLAWPKQTVSFNQRREIRSNFRTYFDWYGKQFLENSYHARKLLKSNAKWLEWFVSREWDELTPDLLTGNRGVREIRGKKVTIFPFLGTIDAKLFNRMTTQNLTTADQFLIAQLAKFGRCLGPGDEKCAAKALEQFHEDLLTSRGLPEWDQRVRELLKAYAANYVRKFPITTNHFHMSASASAKFEETRSKNGGLGRAVESIQGLLDRPRRDVPEGEPITVYSFFGTKHTVGFREPLDEEEVPLDEPTVKLTLFGTESLEAVSFLEALIFATAYEIGMPDGVIKFDAETAPDFVVEGIPFWANRPPIGTFRQRRTFRCRVSTVPENGNKVRVVTVQEYLVVLVTHLQRSLYDTTIKKDPDMTASSHSTIWHTVNHRNWKDPKAQAPRYHRMKLSIDKSRCTDTFSRLKSLAIDEGILEGTPEGSFERTFLESLRELNDPATDVVLPNYKEGKTTLTLDDAKDALSGGDDEYALVVRNAERIGAQFMGGATSYVKLCIWSRFEDDWANAITLGKEREFLLDPKPVNEPGRLIQGDDVVTKGGRTKGRNYRRVCERTGTVIGDGSQFNSRYYAVFCEEPLVRASLRTQWRHLDLIKSRPLIGLNVRKDPRLPAGQTDPYISRGTAINQQLVYLDEADDRRTVIPEIIWRTSDRYREAHRRDRRWTWFHVPTELGGLGYPSKRSKKYVWRKWVPKRLKQIASAIALPNETPESVLWANLLSSTGYVSKRNVTSRAQFIAEYVRPLMQKASTTRKTEWSFKTTEPVQGFVTDNDLKAKAIEEGLFGLDPKDRDEILSRHWKGNRWFRLNIERKSTWIPFMTWLNCVLENFGFAQLLNGLNNVKPFFGLPEWDKVRRRRMNDAWNLLPRVPEVTFENGTSSYTKLLRDRDHLYVDVSCPVWGDLYHRVKQVQVWERPEPSE